MINLKGNMLLLILDMVAQYLLYYDAVHAAIHFE